MPAKFSCASVNSRFTLFASCLRTNSRCSVMMQFISQARSHREVIAARYPGSSYNKTVWNLRRVKACIPPSANTPRVMEAKSPLRNK